MTRIYEEDREPFLTLFTKENVLRDIDTQGVFTTTYRLIDTETPMYVNMKITRMRGGNRLILGVSIIDAHMKQLEEEKRLRQEKVSLGRIAALSPEYIVLYTVDTATGHYTQYNPSNEYENFGLALQGEDFFADVVRDSPKAIVPEDLERHLHVLTKENMISEIQKNGSLIHHYRMVLDGKPVPVSLRATLIQEADGEKIILGITNDEEEFIRQQMEERIEEERTVYARLHALTGNFIVVYVVNPETDRYREFSATDDYEESLAQAKEGADFFGKVREAARLFNHPEDLNRFLTAFTRENVMAEVQNNGIFTLGYRLMMEGRPIHVQMKAAMVEEKEGLRLIVGLNDIDAQVRQEEEFVKRLKQAQSEANVDALTGVKNKHAFLETEVRMDRMIAEHRQAPFAVIMLDINDLKKINDTAGHQAGDQYIRDACQVICDIFKHSPVFRVGGDEFVVISQGRDYTHIENRLAELNEHNTEALRAGGMAIACGMSRFENDECVAAVFERADHNMYENKNALKSKLKEQKNGSR